MLRSKRIKTASGARPRAPGTVDGMNDGIVLTLDAVVPGIDDATFREKANAAKVGCPVSMALSAVPITLEATLRAE